MIFISCARNKYKNLLCFYDFIKTPTIPEAARRNMIAENERKPAKIAIPKVDLDLVAICFLFN